MGTRNPGGARLAAWGAMLLALAGCEEPATPPPDLDPRMQQQLEALGYAEWSDELDEIAATQTGVVHHDPSRSQPGLNLYSREHGDQAFLVDMDGEVVHEWQVDGHEHWVVAKLQPDNDLLVVSRMRSLLRLDWDSNVVWHVPLLAHHDVGKDTLGRLYVLRKDRDFPPTPPGVLPAIGEGVAVISPEGELLREIDFLRLFPEAAPEPTPEAVEAYIANDRSALKGENSDQRFLDTLHPNSVLPLPRDVPGLGRQGDLLLSLRRTSTLALIDPQGERVLWRWGPGVIQRQHNPTLLDDDHLLVFDNGSRERPWSRVVEYAPLEDRIVWEYRADPPESFYSNARGSAQALPNGNVLVTNSEDGEVFEVTREGDVVWRFVNPRLRKKDGRIQRETIYRMTRIHGDALAALPPSLRAPGRGPER